MASETNCPYKNIMSKFSFFNSNKKVAPKEELVNTSMDKEKGLDEGKCPFGFDKKNEKTITKNKKDEKCPLGYEDKQKAEVKNETKEESSDEEQPTGGCPVMNKTKKDPVNKHYEHYYDLPKFGPFDFMFQMRGLLSRKEFEEKTQKLRSYPRHLKYTLFLLNDEKLQKVREKEFPMVFFVYDDIKEKGSKLFRKKKFREAIDYYSYVSLYI